MTDILNFIRINFKFKYILQAVFLFFSAYLLVNYLTGLVEDPSIKRGVAFFAVSLDVAMQFVILARGKVSWKKGSWAKGLIKYRVMAIILFILYAVYVIFYAILSAVGFFMVEVEKTETKITEFKDIQKENRQRLKEIAAEMDALVVQLKTEGGTGYGQNSKTITARMDALKAEREQINQNSGKTLAVKDKLIKGAVNSFDVLAGILGVKKNRLKLLIFGISVTMLQVIIILTSWSGEAEKETKTGTESKTKETLVNTGKEVLSGSTSPADSSWSGEAENEAKTDMESKTNETLVNTENEVLSESTSLVDSSWSGEAEKDTKTDTKLKTNEMLVNTGKEVLSGSTSLVDLSLNESPGCEPEVLKNEFIRFTEALFNDNRKLNGDPVVSQKTGIPLDQCARYRQVLSSLRIGDKTAIFKTQGGSVSNYPKADLLEYLQTNAPEII
jgi:cytochrome c-type biogenesis protein CcmE